MLQTLPLTSSRDCWSTTFPSSDFITFRLFEWLLFMAKPRSEYGFRQMEAEPRIRLIYKTVFQIKSLVYYNFFDGLTETWCSFHCNLFIQKNAKMLSTIDTTSTSTLFEDTDDRAALIKTAERYEHLFGGLFQSDSNADKENTNERICKCGVPGKRTRLVFMLVLYLISFLAEVLVGEQL